MDPSSGWPASPASPISDQPEDPHTPRVGGFRAHAGWIIFGEAQHDDTARLARYAPDLNKDAFYRWLSAWHWVAADDAGLALLAWGGWGMVIWAIFLRVTVGLHATWLINSAHAHLRQAPLPKSTTTQRTSGGWLSPSAKAGTTTITHIRCRYGMASPVHEFDWTWVSLNILKMFGLVMDLRVARSSRRWKLPPSRMLAPCEPRSPVASRSSSSSWVAWALEGGRPQHQVGHLQLERADYLVCGLILFPLIIAGVILNTIFLVREIRRNEQHEHFINAVTHELKTPSRQ